MGKPRFVSRLSVPAVCHDDDHDECYRHEISEIAGIHLGTLSILIFLVAASPVFCRFTIKKFPLQWSTVFLLSSRFTGLFIRYIFLSARLLYCHAQSKAKSCRYRRSEGYQWARARGCDQWQEQSRNRIQST